MHSPAGEKSADTTRLQPGRGTCPNPFAVGSRETATMTLRHAVGIKIRNKTDQVTVEAEDPLIAALKVKSAHPRSCTHLRAQTRCQRRSMPSTRPPDR
jgi:hypothetical protein